MDKKINKEDVMNEFHTAMHKLMVLYNGIDPLANTSSKNFIFSALEKLSKAYGIIQGNIGFEENK